MGPEKEGALFSKIDLLIGLVQGLQAEQWAQGERIARLEGRIEEQSRLLHQMVPRSIAAVPARG